MSWQYILISLSDAYSFVIVIYVLLSWFPMGGIIEEIRNALGKICDPFLNLFKRLIPPIGDGGHYPYYRVTCVTVRGAIYSIIVLKRAYLPGKRGCYGDYIRGYSAAEFQD